MADPQLLHRDAFAEVNDAGGSFKVLNAPFRLSDSTVQVGGYASQLGEHTSGVLAEAGFSPVEIQDFLTSGAAVQG
jgi:formyl-CoA transferase